MRPILRLALPVALFMAFLLAPAGAQTVGQAPLPEKVVGTDDLGDWGGGGDMALVGHAAGQDLLSASIEIPTPDTVKFTMQVSFLPSLGGVPEATRYTWDLHIISLDPEDPERYAAPKFVELDGKFTNYSRGVCDPTSGQCPPPRDPGERPFFIRGNCETVQNVTTCQELGVVKAQFDSARETITVPVPATLLPPLAPCSRISAGPNLFGGTISATPSAYFTSSAMPMDILEVLEDYVLPSEDPENDPCPEYDPFATEG